MATQLVAFDTAPFIYFLQDYPKLAQSARMWFQPLISGEGNGVCSTLVLTELLTGFRKKRDRAGERTAQAFLAGTSNLRVIDVTQVIADRAATLRAKYGLRTPDAIHLATAIESGAKKFVTADRRLSKVKGVRVTVLGT